MIDQVIKHSKDLMDKSIEALQREMGRLRTGRASLAILEDVRVDYYGQKVPLSQVATLGVPEPRMLTVSPWQQNIIADIEKAIQNANLGLNPVNDGKLIRIPIPALTEERRRDLAKILKNHAEEAKIAIRQARRVAMDEFKKLEKDSKITEDDSKKASTQIQKHTDDYIVKVDDMTKKKEQEIMTV